MAASASRAATSWARAVRGVGRGQPVAVLGVGLVRSEGLLELLAQQGVVQVVERQGGVERQLRPPADVGVDGVLLEQRHRLGLPHLGLGQGAGGSRDPGVGELKVGHAGVVALTQCRLLLAQCRDLVGQHLGFGALVGELAGARREHRRGDDGQCGY